ncbi:MAG: hypothetical protein AAFQ10_03340 [Pseudomonadota bacterium]
MNTFKGALASKGIWGGILATIPQVAAMIDPELQGVVTNGISAIGGLLAIYGRWSASSRVQGLL